MFWINDTSGFQPVFIFCPTDHTTPPRKTGRKALSHSFVFIPSFPYRPINYLRTSGADILQCNKRKFGQSPVKNLTFSWYNPTSLKIIHNGTIHTIAFKTHLEEANKSAIHSISEQLFIYLKKILSKWKASFLFYSAKYFFFSYKIYFCI